jgi:preprotein translocase subunit SecG
MQQILLALQILLAVAIIGLVMLQQGRGADAGASFGGGASGSLFGSRGPATFLAKITGLMAALFFINSIGLAYLATQIVRGASVVEQVSVGVDTAPAAVPVPAPDSSDVPVAPSSGGVPTEPAPAGSSQ